MSLPLAVSLAMLRSPLEKSYRNTAYCSALLEQDGGKIRGKYCGQRWCLVCNRVRTARAMTRYLPIVEGWEDKWLVTLTVRNVSGDELPATIAGMIRDTQAIKLGMRRTDGVKLIALRKLECTYNDQRHDYHPHLHYVVQGKRAAELLVARWMELHPDTADRKGQDLRPADAGSMREMFKYFTKL